MNSYERYYLSQAGNGLAGFQGVRYQKGKRFFGRLLSGAVYPLLRFLGENVLNTGVNMANDLLQSDYFSTSNLKTLAKKNMSKGAEDILSAAVSKLQGRGRKRKRKSIKGRRKKVVKKRKRRKRSFDCL